MYQTVILVVQSALEELSRKKAQKANPFAKPKLLVINQHIYNIIYTPFCNSSGAVASKIMSKYGWEEGQGA